jgi:hypothetical protein
VEFDFMDDKVSMEIRGLYNDEYALVAPFMEKQSESAEGITQTQMGQNLKDLSGLKPIFADATRDIEGLNFDNEPIKPEMLARNMELFQLAFDVIVAIVNKSMLTVKEKNLSGVAAPSPTDA